MAAGPSSLTSFPNRPLAPSLVLPDIGGRLHELDNYRGQIVMVNFWATWCPPCRAEMPSFQRLQDQFPRDKFRILAVNIGETREQIAQFFFSQNPQPTYSILMSPEKLMSDQWLVRSLPTTFIVDQTGRVSHMAYGPRAWDSQEVWILVKDLIDSEPPATTVKTGLQLAGSEKEVGVNFK